MIQDLNKIENKLMFSLTNNNVGKKDAKIRYNSRQLNRKFIWTKEHIKTGST